MLIEPRIRSIFYSHPQVLERVVDDLETRCHNNLQSSQLGIEYDEDTQCDVCLSVCFSEVQNLMLVIYV